jgi:hypothetical protein
MRRHWVRSPGAGGARIAENVKERTRSRISAYAEEHSAGRYIRIDVGSRGTSCYIDEKYEPSVFVNGSFLGTPEEVFQTSATYLMG